MQRTPSDQMDCQIGGGLVFGSHYLKNNQDVVIKRKSNSTPWNNGKLKISTSTGPYLTGDVGGSPPRSELEALLVEQRLLAWPRGPT